MALSASIVLEIRQGGSDTNGGGFKTGASGTDWSQQNAAQYSVADGVTNGTTTITSATANFGTDVVGNLIYVQGGTGSVAASWYEITARTNSTTITVDRATGLTAGTGVTLKIGGAFKTWGILTSTTAAIGSLLQDGMRVWIKYNATPTGITTTTAGPAGPCALPANVLTIEGYDVTRGDRTGNRPTYQWQTAPGSATYALTTANIRQHIANLAVDGNANNNACGFLINARGSISEFYVTGCSGTAGVGATIASSQCVNGKINGCLTGLSLQAGTAASLATCLDIVGSGAQTGVSMSNGGGALAKCLVRGMNTGISASANSAIVNCTVDGCSTTGISVGSYTTIANTVISNCGTGVAAGSGNVSVLQTCAYYNNTSNKSGTPVANYGEITLSADPYTNRAGVDFRPNSTVGGGASLRAAGVGVYGQTDNQDVGSVQHADPAGGGITRRFLRGIHW